jgi:hypothetical protein
MATIEKTGEGIERVKASFSGILLLRTKLFRFEEECNAHDNERDRLADHG